MSRTIVFCYDFDKTLTPCDMQEQGLIQSLGMIALDFWKETDELADASDMDYNLSYLYMILKKSEGVCRFTRERFQEFGKDIKLFPGVSDWFERINNYTAKTGCVAEHYIISSGIKEIIEGVSISKYFSRIYASSYLYDDKGYAVWPAQVVNYTNKTQFLFRIKKGVLGVNDLKVNDYIPQSDIRVPFDKFIYIGDSDTDIPCMEIINSSGGFSLGVYNPESNDKRKVNKMISEKRIKYSAPADYTKGGKLESLIFAVIDKISRDYIVESLQQS